MFAQLCVCVLSMHVMDRGKGESVVIKCIIIQAENLVYWYRFLELEAYNNEFVCFANSGWMSAASLEK